MPKLFSFISLLFSFLLSYSQITTTWLGPATGGSWSNASNWSNGVPTSPKTDIVFDGSIVNNIVITDVLQSNANFSYDSLRLINNATVTLTANSAAYFYFDKKIIIESGCRLNIGGTNAIKFEIGGTLSTAIYIDGTLDLQGTGNSSNSTNFVPTSYTFGNGNVNIITGKIILSGINSKFTPNACTPIFVAGSELNLLRDGGFVPKANYKNGSRIYIQGSVNSVPSFSTSSIYDGIIEWNCPGQIAFGSSAIILPSNSFSYVDSLIISNTGNNASVRLATSPANFYVKNIIVNGGKLELSSPGGSSAYVHRSDNVIQNGGTIIGNALGSAGFDNAYQTDTLKILGTFIQNGGTFDFSNRTPVNASPNASFVMTVAGNVYINGTVKLSQPLSAPNCALVFNGTSEQNFSVGTNGIYSNPIRTVIKNISENSGVQLRTNVTLPDALDFESGYIFLNDFNLTL